MPYIRDMMVPWIIRYRYCNINITNHTWAYLAEFQSILNPSVGLLIRNILLQFFPQASSKFFGICFRNVAVLWGSVRALKIKSYEKYEITWIGMEDVVGWSEFVQLIDRCFNTLRLRKNGPHSPDDISKWIFLNENARISINISLKFAPRGLINNIPSLVQIMAWCRSGDKSLSEPMMVKFTDAYMRHSASVS